jgi:hypothetical protein
MNLKNQILCIIFLLLTAGRISGQKDVTIDWNYSGLRFAEFAAQVEIHDSITIFYKEEWVSDIKLGSYSGPVPLSSILGNLFSGRSLYFYIDNSGNVIITKNFAIKVADMEQATGTAFIPSAVYNDQENQKSSGSSVIDIGNPSDRNKPGNVSVSG